MISILDALDDPNLFKPWFRDPVTWQAWRAFLCALFALPMSEDELAIYRQCTGRTEAPTEAASEAALVCGRRAGKSFTLALVAVYLGCFYNYRRYLAPGERGTILILAADRRQARSIYRFARALLTGVPMLARLIERETAESFDLTNAVSIEIGTASFRSTRGATLVAALADEIAYWQNEDSANPDVEILNALRPGMATIPNAMLLLASSPYAKRGALHDIDKRYFGKPGPILIWRAPTRTMNPSVPQRLVDEAMERDPEAARAEWLAEYRSDIAAFVSREVVQRCVDIGTVERPYDDARHSYVAFCDPSGGSADSFTLAIGHLEKEVVIVDVVREIPAPFDPESAVEELAGVLRGYGLREVCGDK